MWTKREIILWVLVISSIAIGATSFFINRPSKAVELRQVGYVDIDKVFDGFDMKIELEKKLEKDLINKKGLIDSLMFQLSSMKNELESEKQPTQEKVEEFYQLQAYYAKQKETYEQYQINETQKYDDQILGQMTQYINDYGKENAYDFIFGADNSGNILYGNTTANITEKVLSFINLKYQGKN